jgi:hypothetical protein
MIIKIEDLPKELYKKIPMTIKLKGGIFDTVLLPKYLEYEILNYINDQIILETYIPEDTKDLVPKLSIYNDMMFMRTSEEAILEYFKNYLLTPKGSYPFDPEFGSELKQQLQKKDDTIRELLIRNELTKVIYLLTGSFEDFEIVLVDHEIFKRDTNGGVEYFMKIKVRITDDIYDITV